MSNYFQTSKSKQMNIDNRIIVPRSNKNQIIENAYSAFQYRIIKYLHHHFTFSDSEAEDVTHDGWTWIIHQSTQMPDISREENIGWIFSIMKKMGLKHIRTQKNESKRIEKAHQVTQIREQRSVFNWEEIIVLIRKNIGEQLSQLLKLYYIDGMCIAAVALHTSLAEQTVKNRLLKARRLLKKQINLNLLL